MKYLVKVKGGSIHFTNSLPHDCDLDSFESIKENPSYEFALGHAAREVLEIAQEEIDERYSGALWEMKNKVLNRLRDHLTKESEK